MTATCPQPPCLWERLLRRLSDTCSALIESDGPLYGTKGPHR